MSGLPMAIVKLVNSLVQLHLRQTASGYWPYLHCFNEQSLNVATARGACGKL